MAKSRKGGFLVSKGRIASFFVLVVVVVLSYIYVIQLAKHNFSFLPVGYWSHGPQADANRTQSTSRDNNNAKSTRDDDDDGGSKNESKLSSRIEMITRYHRKGLHLRSRFNCSLLFDGDAREGSKALRYLHRQRQDRDLTMVSDSDAMEMLKSCRAFSSIREYKVKASSRDEADFAFAYVILMHEDFEQMERLVRALYQPQNVFCIHVDRKSPASLHHAVSAFASCFPNVHVASRSYNITYAHVTRLLADIGCMADLSRLDHRWKYLITMTSTEFPLHSNADKVRIATLMNGTNNIRETYKSRVPRRYSKVFNIRRGRMYITNVEKEPPPHNLTIVKGRAGNSFSRAFVEWFQKDQRAQDLLKWSEDTYSPDEHYWATLNNLYHNAFLNTPGGYYGRPDTKLFFTVFTVWSSPEAPKQLCHSHMRHRICLFGTLDLPLVKNASFYLAANKFDLLNDPVAYACMEELLEYREVNGEPDLNFKLYIPRIAESPGLS